MSTYATTIEYLSLGITNGASIAESQDGELIHRCKNGDHSAFDELFKRYRNQVYQLAYRMSRNQQDAEDIVQNAFIRAFKYIERFDSKYPFYPWLRMIVTNESQTYLEKRTRKHHESVESSDPDKPGLMEVTPDTKVEMADDLISRKELRVEISKAIQKLPEQQRVCFILFEIEEMKVREIADQLGCTEGTVKTHLHRARFSLRNLLKNVIHKP